MDRHVPASTRILRGSEQLRHEVVCCEAPVPEDAVLSVLCEDGVVRAQARCTAHRYALLAGTHHVKGDFALSLGVEHDDVHDRDENHVCVEPEQLGIAYVGRSAVFVHNGAFLIDDAIRGHGIVGAGPLEVERVRELGVDRAWEADADAVSVEVFPRA